MEVCSQKRSPFVCSCCSVQPSEFFVLRPFVRSMRKAMIPHYMQKVEQFLNWRSFTDPQQGHLKRQYSIRRTEKDLKMSGEGEKKLSLADRRKIFEQQAAAAQQSSSSPSSSSKLQRAATWFFFFSLSFFHSSSIFDVFLLVLHSIFFCIFFFFVFFLPFGSFFQELKVRLTDCRGPTITLTPPPKKIPDSTSPGVNALKTKFAGYFLLLLLLLSFFLRL